MHGLGLFGQAGEPANQSFVISFFLPSLYSAQLNVRNYILYTYMYKKKINSMTDNND